MVINSVNEKVYLQENCLVFIMMQHGGLKKMSTCPYLSMLAMVDTGRYKTLCKNYIPFGLHPECHL